MTKSEIGSYRRRLPELRRRVLGDRSELEDEVRRPLGGESGGAVSDLPTHPADLGSEDYEEEATLELLENEDRILKEIDDALAPIERGTFGRCENCHREIPRERLDALPYARYCIECARRLQGAAPS